MMSAEELRSRCVATLRKSYGRAGAPHAGMDGESLVEALLGSGKHIENRRRARRAGLDLV